MKKSIWLCVGIVGLLVLGPGAMLSRAETEPARALRVTGAAMSADQVEIWAREFMQTNSGSRVVVTGSSAGKGADALVEGNTEI